MNLDARTTVNPDGTGKITLTVALDDVAVSTAENFSALIPLDGQGDIQQRMLASATDAFSAQNGYQNVVIETPANQVGLNVSADFESYQVLQETFTTKTKGFFSAFAITQTESGWVLQAVPAPMPATDAISLIDTADIQPSIRFTFTMPGTLIDSNATSSNDTTATWDIFQSKPKALTATWSNEPPAQWGKILPIYLFTLTAIMALIVIVRRRKNKKHTSAA